MTVNQLMEILQRIHSKGYGEADIVVFDPYNMLMGNIANYEFDPSIKCHEDTLTLETDEMLEFREGNNGNESEMPPMWRDN